MKDVLIRHFGKSNSQGNYGFTIAYQEHEVENKHFNTYSVGIAIKKPCDNFNKRTGKNVAVFNLLDSPITIQIPKYYTVGNRNIEEYILGMILFASRVHALNNETYQALETSNFLRQFVALLNKNKITDDKLFDFLRGVKYQYSDAYEYGPDDETLFIIANGVSLAFGEMPLVMQNPKSWKKINKFLIKLAKLQDILYEN